MVTTSTAHTIVAGARVAAARTGNHSTVKTHTVLLVRERFHLGRDSHKAEPKAYCAVEIRLSFAVNRKMKLGMFGDRQNAFLGQMLRIRLLAALAFVTEAGSAVSLLGLH